MEYSAAHQLMICHSIPGRLRMKFKAFRDSSQYRQKLENELSQFSHVRRFEIRASTGSIIVLYDAKRIQADQLIERTVESLQETGNSPVTINKVNPIIPAKVWFAPKLAIAVLTPGRLWNVVTLSGFLAYSLARRFLLGSPLSQQPNSMTGAAAALGTLSLAWQSLVEIRNHKRFGLQPFLTVACALGIFMGEALTAMEILWVLGIGRFVERLIAERSRRAIRDLLTITPDRTYVLVDEVEVETLLENVFVGDVVVVHSGERLPVDGVVTGGSALVDEAHITGRSDPELREAEDYVYAGATVVQGNLFIRADKVGKDTYLNHILNLVESSLANRADVEKKADQLAARLVRFGSIATIGTLAWTQSLNRSLAVLLMMSCPCATVLATSTALAAAIANAARKGILIKGGRFLEGAHRIDTLVFDKTGTITVETPQVIEILTRAPWQEPDQVLGLAANAENASNHPMARALREAAGKRGLPLAKGVRSEASLGRGVHAELNSEILLVGNAQFMAEQDVDSSYFRAKADKYQNVGNTVVYLARNGKLQAMIVFGNQVREKADMVVAWLRQDGIESISLVSGDTLPIIRSLANSMGFDEYRAELLPKEKAEYIDRLKAAGKQVMMVGDGLNDALALAQATVGIAMGAGGSEVAIEAADIALMKNDLQGLVSLRQLSHRSFDIIEQNFWIATVTNLLGVGLGMFGVVPPVMAGVVHTVHSLGIMLNSGRLLAMEFPAASPDAK